MQDERSHTRIWFVYVNGFNGLGSNIHIKLDVKGINNEFLGGLVGDKLWALCFLSMACSH